MLNCVTIYAIRKTSSLPRTLKALLLSLAVSDVAVGLLGKPFYISLLVTWLQQKDPDCNTYKGLLMISGLFCLASILGVVALSVDRFLAIHLHLRYQELVTHKRVVSVVILIWVLSVFISFFHDLVGFIGYYPCCYDNPWSSLSSCYSCGLHQNLFGRTTPQKSDSCLASTPSRREQRNNKFNQHH